MIEIETPGRDTLRLEHLVLDVNGTIAVAGSRRRLCGRQVDFPLPLPRPAVDTPDVLFRDGRAVGKVGIFQRQDFVEQLVIPLRVT